MSSTTRTPDAQSLTPEQMRAEAQAWYERQLAILEKAHGARWPEHRAWLEAYLKQSLRERLIARGWRYKK
ncbi:hypothetical protein [Hydrogenophaga sp. T2]|uniref:hypothetical protein n=1 Tax=Hydrogenophaga sp. T2 TaxID=3132823 RepID=UPI003CECF4CC